MQLGIAVLLSLLASTPSWATFHIALIDEDMSQAVGDPSIQFVEIRMLASLQNSVANTRLTTFNCEGTSFTVLLRVPFKVPMRLGEGSADPGPGPNRGQMASYRGGICGDLAHEHGHMRLLSLLPGGRPAATSGAHRAKQQWFSPADADLRQTLGGCRS